MSDAEWDKDDYEPPKVSKSTLGDRWEGEDEDDVKENWDDEDAREEPSTQDEPKAMQMKKKKPLSQVIAEKEERLRKEKEEKRLQVEEAAHSLTPEGQLEEKLRRQQMQEESDLQLAKDAFGITDGTPAGAGIDSMNPSTKEEFEEFKKAIVNKILQFEKSTFFTMLLDDVFRELSVNLESEDIKKLASTLNAVANEKSKSQKTTKSKKKTKKAGLNVGKGSNDINDIGEAYGNEFDDFI